MDADAVIVTLGLNLTIEDETRDRATIELPGKQMDLVTSIREVCVLMPNCCVLEKGGRERQGEMFLLEC